MLMVPNVATDFLDITVNVCYHYSPVAMVNAIASKMFSFCEYILSCLIIQAVSCLYMFSAVKYLSMTSKLCQGNSNLINDSVQESACAVRV